MTTKRTLPWTAEKSPRDEVHDATIYGLHGSLPVLIADVMDKDEAAFIVKAANNHDDLVMALQMTLPVLEWCEKQWANSPQQGEGMSVLKIVRAVIAEAAS